MSGYSLPLYNVPVYVNAAALPAAGTLTPIPTLAITQDTNSLYVFSINSAAWILLQNLSSASYATTATAAGTTALLYTSSYQQFFTGSTTQTVTLPVTSTMLGLGQGFLIVNNSSGVVTVQSSGSNTIQAMAANTAAVFTCISLTGTGSASWNCEYSYNLNVGALPVALGGTAVASVTTAPTASSFAGWDANSNFSSNNFLGGYATTATAAGTTTLTVASKEFQYFTGTTTQTVLLPVTSTLVLGMSYTVVNNSTGVVTVQSSGTNTIVALVSQSSATFTCIAITGTGVSSWNMSFGQGQYFENNCASGSAVSVTSGSITDVDSGGGSPVGIVLAAGVYDIQLACSFIVAASTSITKLSTWVGTASGNVTTGQDLARNYASLATAANVMSGTQTLVVPAYRVVITGSTTYYLKATATFSVSTLTAYGNLRATRIY